MVLLLVILSLLVVLILLLLLLVVRKDFIYQDVLGSSWGPMEIIDWFLKVPVFVVKFPFSLLWETAFVSKLGVLPIRIYMSLWPLQVLRLVHYIHNSIIVIHCIVIANLYCRHVSSPSLAPGCQFVPRIFKSLHHLLHQLAIDLCDLGDRLQTLFGLVRLLVVNLLLNYREQSLIKLQ